MADRTPLLAHPYRSARTPPCSERIKTILTPIRAPQANAYAERFVRTVRSECLDWLLILGRRHLEHVLRTYSAHYNKERPHRGLALLSPAHANQPNERSANKIGALRPPRRTHPQIPSRSVNTALKPLNRSCSCDWLEGGGLAG